MKKLLSFNPVVISAVLCLAIVLLGVSKTQSSADITQDQIRQCDSLMDRLMNSRVKGLLPEISVFPLLKTKRALDNCRIAVTRHPDSDIYNFAYGLSALSQGDHKGLDYIRKSYKKGYFPALFFMFSMSLTHDDVDERPTSKVFAPIYTHKNHNIRLLSAQMMRRAAVDPKFIEKVLQSLIDEENIEAMVALAKFYENAMLGKVPYSKFLSLYKKAAEAKNHYAQWKYGQCLVYGQLYSQFCKEDVDKGYRMVLSAARAGFNMAQYFIKENSYEGLFNHEKISPELKKEIDQYNLINPTVKD